MKRLLVFALIVHLCGCENSSPEQNDRKDGFTPVLKSREDSLYHDVMEGHDIGMAKMSKLRAHLNKVQRELDSINKLSPSKVAPGYKQTLIDLQEELNYADHAMFTWMGEFKVDSANENKEKRLSYLESEKLKVEKVRDNILNSLRRADSLFKHAER